MSKDLEKIIPAGVQIADKFNHGKLIELIDGGFETYKVDGHTLVRSKSDDEFIDYILMGDQYFYNNWITQFALGEIAGRNYFDMGTWSDLTEKLTKGVIVVHEETKQFLFLIPKFIEPQYSENARSIIDRLCTIASNAKFQQGEQQAETVNTFAQQLMYVTEKDVPNEGLTGLIPAAIYEFYDIVPKAMKAVIYIRDHYRTITEDDDRMDKLTAILKNHFRGKLVSDADKKFVLELTNGEFNFDDGVDRTGSGESESQLPPPVEEEYDPLVD